MMKIIEKTALPKNSYIKYLFTFLKLLITCGLCAVILYYTDFISIKDAIHKSNKWMLLIVFVSMFLGIIVSAKKWQILLEIHKIFFSFHELTKIYLIGSFFNNFLPSTVGGDGYRIYRTMENNSQKAGSVISVLAERIFGVVVLLVLGFSGAVISYFKLRDPVSTYGVIFGALGVLSFLPFFFVLILKKPKTWFLNHSKIPVKFKKFFLTVGDYYHQPRKFIQFLFVTVVFYLILFSYRLLLIYSLGDSCSIYTLAMVIMISNIIAILPLSINGIGLLDGSFIILISKFGVSYENALIVMVIQRTAAVIISLLGGFLYYMDAKSHH